MFNDPMGDLPASAIRIYDPYSGAAWQQQSQREFYQYAEEHNQNMNGWNGLIAFGNQLAAAGYEGSLFDALAAPMQIGHTGLTITPPSSEMINIANPDKVYGGDKAYLYHQGGIVPNRDAFRLYFNPTESGARMGIYWTDPGYKFQSYQWMQTVSSSGEYDRQLGIRLNSPHLDGSRDRNGRLLNYPFYYKKSELPIINRIASNMHATIYFNDSPSGESWFEAETTLLGVGSNGSLTPLGSFTWGYATAPGGPIVVSPMFSPAPSQFQQNIINNYNRRLK